MQDTTDSLDYFSQRLHSRHKPRMRLRIGEPHRVTRRICVRLARGSTEVIPHVDRSVVVRCAKGSVWLTHDGDPKDIILDANQTYHADREHALWVHALQPCVLEFQFDDELTAREELSAG